jgi:uncharacterized protein (DUF1501 family)
MRCCDGHASASRGPRRGFALSRRELLRRLARGAGVAAVAPSLLQLLGRQALAQEGTPARRKKLILLWLEGGPSQIDTFDPKPGAPTHGEFKAIETGIPGWQMSEHLPQLAKSADRLALIRTVTSQESTHARARELLHAGYTPNASVAYPSLGSLVAHEIGDLDHDLPAFVQVTGAPCSSGFLGIECEPFLVADPLKKIDNLGASAGARQAADPRDEMLALLDAGFAKRGGAHTVAANETQRRRARRLMQTKLLGAFDLSGEPAALREAYGAGAFGQGVLLARRLIEHGVAAVEVILDGWDTHNDNFNRTRDLCQQLDPALATLLADLQRRELLEETLVVCMGEFGRTPTITPSSGRNHWPNNYCVVLAGGGIQPGRVIGATDATGEKIVARPVQVADLFATFAQALGLERDKEFATPLGRTIRLVDPEGESVRELFA